MPNVFDLFGTPEPACVEELGDSPTRESPVFTLLEGDCVEVLKQVVPSNSLDSICCDPPYGLKFMDKGWDSMGHGSAQQAWHIRWLAEALRVLKPGAHLVAFGSTRTFHRLVCAAEDAGFEIRDTLSWHYGQGWPKGLNVGKAVDGLLLHGRSDSVSLKQVNAGRPGSGRVRPSSQNGWEGTGGGIVGGASVGPKVTNDTPSTPEGAQWQDWGTSIKPATEQILLARKPLSEKTVAENVLKHGTSALNIGGSRVGGEGRYPANLLLTHHPECVLGDTEVDSACQLGCPVFIMDKQSDGSSRFFFRGKAGNNERWGYCHACEEVFCKGKGEDRTAHKQCLPPPGHRKAVEWHATVKPLDVMSWLVRLVTPEGGWTLDPFGGTGSTADAALREGFNVMVVEKSPVFAKIIAGRIRQTHGVESEDFPGEGV